MVVALLGSFSAGATSVGCSRGSLVVSRLTTGCPCADSSAPIASYCAFVLSFGVAERCSVSLFSDTTSVAVVG